MTPIALAVLDAASRIMLQNGIRVLQGARLGPTERDHIWSLLPYLHPGRREHWIDIGCGFGEPAKLMADFMPDIRLTLVNNNPFQLEQCDHERFQVKLADMHALPFEDAAFDGAMFLWSLCHADDWGIALAEAARVVQPGGHLFVYDLARIDGDDVLSSRMLNAQFIPAVELGAIGSEAGWQSELVVFPQQADFSLFRQACGDEELFRQLTAGLVPVIWRAERRA